MTKMGPQKRNIHAYIDRRICTHISIYRPQNVCSVHVSVRPVKSESSFWARALRVLFRLEIRRALGFCSGFLGVVGERC